MATLRAVGRALGRDAANFLFPRVCLVCAREMQPGSAAFVCDPCWAGVVPLPHPRCARCGHPRRRAACHWCEHVHPAVTAVRSWCWADNRIAETLVHALKYHGWSGAAREIAERMSRLDFGAAGPVRDRVLVPVPLADGRLRERGYNQSACLAAALARRWDVACAHALVERLRETPTQTRLTPEQRLHNVADAFRVDAARLSSFGKAAFVLVDDVVTTGATLNACAEALATAGAQSICYITFGRARDPRDAAPSPGPASHGHSSRD